MTFLENRGGQPTSLCNRLPRGGAGCSSAWFRRCCRNGHGRRADPLLGRHHPLRHLACRGFDERTRPETVAAISIIEPTCKGEHDMNWDRIEGNWKQFTGKVKEKWGDLTDDDLTTINGRRD